MAVRIRMKKMGRRHRPFYRVCATDGRRPRDGRVLEELGTYDPMISEVDARALLNGERVAYWLSVGAQPSDKVQILIDKYGAEGTHLKAQEEARARLALPKVVPAQGEPAYVPPSPAEKEAAAAEASEEPKAEAATEEAPAAESTETAEAVAEPEASSEASDEGEKTE